MIRFDYNLGHLIQKHISNYAPHFTLALFHLTTDKQIAILFRYSKDST